MRVRVIHGTPQHNVSLCDSCNNVKRRRGVRFADTWYGCEEMPGTIPQPVAECTSYSDMHLKVPAEMMKQAFKYVPSLGCFLSPVDWDQARAKNKLTAVDY